MITAEDIQLGRQTVVLRADWLPPDTGWEELDRARERQLTIVRELGELKGKLRDANAVYEREDRKRDEQLAQDFASDDPAKLRHVTSESERAKVRDDFGRRLRAGYVALAEHVNATVALVERGKGELVRQQRAVAHELEQKRDAYVARAQELQDALAAGRKLDTWLARTAGEQRGFESDAMRLYPWGEVERPPTFVDGATRELFEEEMARRRDAERSPFLANARAAIAARDVPADPNGPQTEQRSERRTA